MDKKAGLDWRPPEDFVLAHVLVFGLVCHLATLQRLRKHKEIKI